MVVENRLGFGRRRGIEGALNRADIHARLFGHQPGDAFVSASTLRRTNCDILSRFEFFAGGDQLGKAPYVLMLLLGRKVEPVQVLGDLLQLGGDRVVVRVDAVDMRPTQLLGGSKAARACGQPQCVKARDKIGLVAAP